MDHTREDYFNLTIIHDPNFLIMESGNKDEFIFYNSIKHWGCRIKRIELFLLEKLYKYENIDYITSQFPSDKQEIIRQTLQRISKNGILSIEAGTQDKNDKDNISAIQLHVFYLHLTYRCNLSCTYCYNKNIRTQFDELALSDWKKIIDKIAPYASHIILTGGECFLYRDIVPLLQYIRKQMENVVISIISNCMTDFSDGEMNEAFKIINDVSFSCDSIDRAGERKGFVPERFKKNINYLKSNIPNLKINIATTNTNDNKKDIENIDLFCRDFKYAINNTSLIPGCLEEISKMPPISDFRHDTIIEATANKHTFSELPPKKIRCGAAKKVCSITPTGNVYPCQTMHYKEFFMGNLLQQEITDLKYQNEEELIPSVDEITACAKCKVKYLCGGGCLSSTYALRKGKLDRNQLLCPYNYQMSIARLIALKNHPYE